RRRGRRGGGTLPPGGGPGGEPRRRGRDRRRAVDQATGLLTSTGTARVLDVTGEDGAEIVCVLGREVDLVFDTVESEEHSFPRRLPCDVVQRVNCREPGQTRPPLTSNSRSPPKDSARGRRAKRAPVVTLWTPKT